MKKQATLLLLAILTTLGSRAQSPYRLSTLTQAYTPLTGATSLNGTTPWFSALYAMPLGFSVQIGGSTVSRVFGDGTDLYTDTTGASVKLFQIFYSDSGQFDRGWGTATSRSPMSYMTSGTAPNRIFKYEVRGAGFPREQKKYGTLNDSVTWQMWIYEGSNVVELHYGPSQITHATDYFPGGTGPAFAGFFNVNFNTGMPIAGYFASGAVTAPTIDSFTASHNPANLSAYPASGTVYRFAPVSPTGVESVGGVLNAQVYPTVSTGKISVSYADAQSVSYMILSAGGAIAAHGELHGNAGIIGVEALPAGIYTLRLQAGSKSAAYRFVKQ